MADDSSQTLNLFHRRNVIPKHGQSVRVRVALMKIFSRIRPNSAKLFLSFSQYKGSLSGKKNQKEKKEKPLSEKVSQVICLHDKTHGIFENFVLEKCNTTWKQVNFELGPSPTQALYVHGHERVHGHKQPLEPQGEPTSFLNDFYSYSQKCNSQYDYSNRKITLGNDVETNQGPKIIVKSYNVSGMKEYDKLKRVLNFGHKILKEWIGIFAIQETHLTQDDIAKLDLIWKGKYVLSPGTNSARGSLILFADWHFDKIDYIKRNDDGRTS